MRLLRLKDNDDFELTNFILDEKEIPPYAILSHTWRGDGEEVTYQDVIGGTAKSKVLGHKKILFCGEQARKDGLDYFWVDTCCINKESSPELSEAINTMYRWYQNSSRCYVYLIDVSLTGSEVMSPATPQGWEEDFRNSRWFRRGWTLQELLAPKSVEFFSEQGFRLGDKKSLEQIIHQITRISTKALRGEQPLADFTVKERFSWAQSRETTRREDKAYCLLGIFDIFMPHIYGEGDNAFKRLQEEIDRTRYLLDRLPVNSSAPFNSLVNQYGSSCLPDTRIELLREVESWIQGENSTSVFWLSGIAGTGKSTVARTIARTNFDRGTLGGSFFFSHGGGDNRSASKLFTTLAVQMARQIAATKSHICESVRDFQGISISEQSLSDQWNQLIIEPLSRVVHTSGPLTVVLVLDALDECDNEGDISIILKLFAATHKLDGVRLRIFLTSRPEIRLRSGFDQIPEAERQSVALHDIEPRLVDRDLKLFFEFNLRAIREQRGLDADWPGQNTVARLVAASSGLFIWASTACRYIEAGRRFANKRISNLFNGSLPNVGPEKQLDQIYHTVLRASVVEYDEDEREEVYLELRKVLGAIVILFSPLPVHALADLLQVSAANVIENLTDLHAIFIVPSETSRPVRAHHPTFRDFLLNKDRCTDTDFWIDEQAAHRTLAYSCIELMSKKLQQNICGLTSPGTMLEEIEQDRIERHIPSHLRYACRYWAEHFRHSGIALQDDDDVHRFFKKYFLNWLEVMSIIGKVSEVASVIRMYHSLLVPQIKNAKQIPFVRDSRRFIYAFQSIFEQAPLQVYCAALAFTKPSNELRPHFWKERHEKMRAVRIITAMTPKNDGDNYVCDLTFMSEGRLIASGSLDPWVRVWDVATKAPLTKYSGQTDKISSVDFAPSKSLLASGSDDGTVMVWDTVSKKMLYELTAHSRWVNTVKFSPGGALLASGSMDETICLWSMDDGREVYKLETHSSCVNSLAFSPDGGRLASGTVDQLIRLWDVEKGVMLTVLEGHLGPINSVQFSPIGDKLVSGSDDMTVRVWDHSMGATINVLKGHSKRVWAVTFSHDASVIVSGSEDKTIRIWDTLSGDLRHILCGHDTGINAVAFSPNDQIIASCSFNDEVRLWDAHAGQPMSKLIDFVDDTEFKTDEKSNGHVGPVTHLILSPDGYLMASGSQLSTDTDESTQYVGENGPPDSPDRGTIKLWTQGGEQLHVLVGHLDHISQLIFTPDNKLLVSASTDQTIRIWEPGTGNLLHRLEVNADIKFLRVCPQSRLLASYSSDSKITIWDLTTGMKSCVLQGYTGMLNDMTFSPTDHLFVSCSHDAMICVWDLMSPDNEPIQISAHDASIRTVKFSADGTRLASCSSDHTIGIWDASGSRQTSLRGHDFRVNSAAFSQDGEKLVSCSDDKTVRIWDIATAVVEHVLHVDTVLNWVSFSNCGRYINTDRGDLSIDSSTGGDDPHLSRSTHALFCSDDWVRQGTENIFWLPDDYRPTAVTIWDDVVVLGHSTGAISFLKF